MRNLKFVLLSLFTVALLFSCGGKYSDYEKAVEGTVSVTEDFAQNLEKAEDAKAVAKILTDFTTDKKVIKADEELEKVSAKYPEINLDDPSTFPAEWENLPEQQARMGKAMETMISVVLPYAEDPDVAAALDALVEAAEKK